jgi:hypothetical protein
VGVHDRPSIIDDGRHTDHAESVFLPAAVEEPDGIDVDDQARGHAHVVYLRERCAHMRGDDCFPDMCMYTTAMRDGNNSSLMFTNVPYGCL